MPNPDELESERRELLEQCAEDLAEDKAANYAPGSFGCHELLDRTSLILGLLEEQVVEHPSCLQQPGWSALAREATEILSRLYQEIGAAHLSHQATESRSD